MVTITIDGRAVSLNATKKIAKVGGNYRQVPSQKGREGEARIMNALIPYRTLLKAFAAAIDRRTHGIGMSYTFHYEMNALMTKKGQLSFSTPDVDNSFKLVKDQIFKVMNLNDGMVIELSGRKLVSTHEYMTVQLYEVPLPWNREKEHEKTKIQKRNFVEA